MGYSSETVPRTVPVDAVGIADFVLAGGAASPVDVNGDNLVNAIDVQIVINSALGLPVDTGFVADVDRDGVVNAVDIQAAINFVLGF